MRSIAQMVRLTCVLVLAAATAPLPATLHCSVISPPPVAGAPSFEIVHAPRARAHGFASLSTSALGQQAAQQHQPGRLLSQVPLFDVARAAAGPAIETGMRVVRVAGDGRCMFR